MDIKKKALEFAVRAHGNQVRKAEKDKPSIIHPIGVGILLEEYGFDDNLVAAGYLHDVVEDTDVTIEDIYREFGRNVGDLVKGASEEDRSLPWEMRKLGTIKRVESLDLRSKFLPVCDKIKNTENLLNLSERTGGIDYSSFNRGKDKKVWYWQEVYKALVKNEDENHPLFVRLKKNIDLIANDEKEKLDCVMFDKEVNDDVVLRKLYYKGLDVLELKNVQQVLENLETYVICLLGLDDEDKNKIINNVMNYLKMFDFNISSLNLSWSFEEIRELSLDEDGTLFIKKIDERLQKLVGVVKNNNRNDLVLINSNLCNELIELGSFTDKLDVKSLKYLRYYLDVVSQLVNKSVLLEKSEYQEKEASYYSFLCSFLEEQDNCFKYRLLDDYEDGSLLCDKIVDGYKEEQLSNMKRLIKEYKR